jgi:hypothetical protein
LSPALAVAVVVVEVVGDDEVGEVGGGADCPVDSDEHAPTASAAIRLAPTRARCNFPLRSLA